MIDTVEFLFDTPRCRIADIITYFIQQCDSVKIIAGFLTEEGIGLIFDPIQQHPEKLQKLIIGMGSQKAFDALDTLISGGVDISHLCVNLGFTRLTPHGKYPYLKYHPMLHSKIYYFELSGNKATAMVGSHNITGYALGGKNGEASIVIEGDRSENIFAEIRQHIEEASASSVPYSRQLKEAYAEWYRDYIDGLTRKILFKAAEGTEMKETVIIIATMANPADVIQDREVLFFRVPKEVKALSFLKKEVHLFIFSSIPASPQIAISQLKSAIRNHWGTVSGSNEKNPVRNTTADWIIADIKNPVIERTPAGFDTRGNPDELQVFVTFRYDVKFRYDYFFHKPKLVYLPELDQNPAADPIKQKIHIGKHFIETCVDYEKWEQNLPNWEQGPWYRVIALKPIEAAKTIDLAKEYLSPVGGVFILYSTSRTQK